MRFTIIYIAAISFSLIGLTGVNSKADTSTGITLSNQDPCKAALTQENQKLAAGTAACQALCNMSGGDDDDDDSDSSPCSGGIKDCAKAVNCSNAKADNTSDTSNFCKSLTDQQKTDMINKDLKSEKTTMDDDIKNFQKIQDDAQNGVKGEQQTETNLQKEITTAQGALQQNIIQAKDSTDKIDSDTQEKLTELQDLVAQQRADAENIITSKRQDVMNKYQMAVDQARQACANTVTTQAQAGTLQFASTGMALQCTSMGTVNCRCNQNRVYRDALQEAQSDMISALQQLETDYSQKEADITKSVQQMANAAQSATNAKNTIMLKEQAAIQQTTQQIQSDTQSLAQAKQQFMQQQQQLQQRMMQANTQQQVSTAKYQKDYTALQQLEGTGCGGSGCSPNATDNKANQFSDLQKQVLDGLAAQSYLDSKAAACTASSASTGGSQTSASSTTTGSVTPTTGAVNIISTGTNAPSGSAISK